MNDLLALAINAHGGLARWNAIQTIEVDLSINGVLWEWKQLSGVFANKTVVANTKHQRVSVSPIGSDKLVYTPERVWIENAEGHVVDQRDSPALAFAGQVQETPWDIFHAAFFNGRALWTYLTQPFLYASPGFAVEEIEPWHEDGEIWRSLRVTFPSAVSSHTETQITRFGPDGLIRRHDYNVDLLGGAEGVNYASNYRTVDGIVVPMRRRVYPRDAAMQRAPEPLLVSIDITAIRFNRS